MTIQQTDLFLVNTSGGATIAGNKKCEAQNLNGKNGNVLVNRGGVSHKTSIVNIPTTVRDNDLMLVNRGGASFKVTGAEVQTLFPQGPAGGTDVIEAVVDTELEGGWTAASAAAANQWNAITYGDGKFVAVGDGDTAMYSTDGISWTSTPAADYASWSSVTYAKDASNPNQNVKDGLFVAVSQGFDLVMHSPDGISWTITTGANASEWKSVTYGDGKFVAVSMSAADTAQYSTDGINWTATPPGPEYNQWQSVTYGNGKFVAVASTGTNKVMNSDNGINWKSASLTDGSGNSWTSVTYGDGKFVAVAQSWPDNVIYSTDGINWKATQGTENNLWTSVTYGNGKFVAVGTLYSTSVMYSADAITWYSGTPAEENPWTSVTYGNDKFVAVSDSGTHQVMWSYTGTGESSTKSDLTLASDKNLDTFTPGDGLKMVDTDGNTAAYVPITSAITAVSEAAGLTTLALTFTSKDLKYFNTGDRVTQAANFGTVTRVGPDELVLTDTVLPGGWNFVSVPQANELLPTGLDSVAYGNGKFVAVSSNTNLVMYSADGITWSSAGVTGVPANLWVAVTYADGKFVAVAYNGTNRVMYSADGITWTAVSAAAANGWNAVTYGDGKFVALSQDGTDQVMYSADGITWSNAGVTGVPVPASSWISVTYADDKFVAVALGGNTFVMYSYDGITWYEATAAAANMWYDVTYGNGKFVAVANDGTNQVMYSDDGITWSNTGVTGAEYNLWMSVTYGNGKFVAVALNSATTMHSADGIKWTVIAGTADDKWRSVTYGGGKFVAVSTNPTKQVMYSYTGTDDGIECDWTTSVGQGAELGKPLSGTGTYGSHTGSVLTVNSSNTEWVDNNNQRGDNYYITTGTTRLSLAKALTINDYGVMTTKARTWAATAIAGYYPLYRFQKIAELAGNGSTHSHTFDGVTWYMPEGVTYYHGDYSG
jgi:hypothetical protein